MSDNSAALPFSTKFLYGFGSIAYGIKDNAFAYFLLFVYVQVFGLAPNLAGLAILVMLVFDAISDPLIGYLSDNTHSRWGRRHPYIYGSVLPVALTFFLIWDPPAGLSQNELFWYLLLVGVGIRTAITIYEIPSSALGPELTQDYVERSSLLAYRNWFGWWGGLAMWNLLWIFVVVSSRNGTQDARYLPETWVLYGIGCSIVMAIAIMVTGVGTHRHIPDLHVPKAASDQAQRTNFFKGLWRTLTVSKNYRILFVAMIVCWGASGLATNLTLFFYSFFWELKPINILTIGVSLFLAPLVSLKAAPMLAASIGKKRTALTFFTASMIIENLLLLLRVLDILPENGTTALISFVLAFHWMGVCCVIIATVTVASMVFDTVEEVELVTKTRMEGTLLAARSFAQKCMSGLGAFSAGLILQIAAWPEDARAGFVEQATLNTVATTAIVASVLLWTTGIWLVSLVDANQESHNERLRNLAGANDEA